MFWTLDLIALNECLDPADTVNTEGFAVTKDDPPPYKVCVEFSISTVALPFVIIPPIYIWKLQILALSWWQRVVLPPPTACCDPVFSTSQKSVERAHIDEGMLVQCWAWWQNRDNTHVFVFTGLPPCYSAAAKLDYCQIYHHTVDRQAIYESINRHHSSIIHTVHNIQVTPSTTLRWRFAEGCKVSPWREKVMHNTIENEVSIRDVG